MKFRFKAAFKVFFGLDKFTEPARTKLSEEALQRFESLLNPGVVVEAKVTDEGKFLVRALPSNPDEIPFGPLLVHEKMDVLVRLVAEPLGADPVDLGVIPIPAGFHIVAIKGAR